MKRIIDKDKPLPSNTIYDWNECFAKLILESKVPNLFKKLEIKDKPDLQDKIANVGVEVTTAISENKLKLDRLYTDLEYNLARNVDKVKAKINELGGKLSNGILFHPVQYRNLETIDNALKDKLNKINGGGYKIFNKNYVFITDTTHILENELDELLFKYEKIQKEYVINYDKIFLYLYGGKLFEFDMTKHKVYTYIFSSNETFKISNDARKMVEDKENEIM